MIPQIIVHSDDQELQVRFRDGHQEVSVLDTHARVLMDFFKQFNGGWSFVPRTTTILKFSMKGRSGIKKNSRINFVQRGRQMSLPSKKYSQFEKELKTVIALAMIDQGIQEPINVPVNLKLVIHFKNHQNEPDLSNSYQGIEDCLEDCGVLVNDKLIYSHDGSAKVFGAKEDWFEVELTTKELK